MATSVLERLVVEITGDTAQLNSALSKGESRLASFRAAATRVASVAGTALVGAFAAAGTAVLVGATKMGQAADHLLDLQQQTGLSTDKLQEFQNVARVAGVASDTLALAAEGLTRRLRAAGTDTQTFVDNVTALGVNVKTSTGSLRSMDDVLPEIITKLQGMTDVTTRNALATQIFGRQATALAPVLGLTADQLQRAQEQAHEMGQVLSGEALNAANNFRISQEQLRAKLELAGREIVVALLPALQSIAGLLDERVIPNVQKFADFLVRILPKFTDFSGAADKATTALRNVQDAAGLNATLATLGNSLTGDAKTAWDTYRQSVDATGDSYDTLVAKAKNAAQFFAIQNAVQALTTPAATKALGQVVNIQGPQPQERALAALKTGDIAGALNVVNGVMLSLANAGPVMASEERALKEAMSALVAARGALEAFNAPAPAAPAPAPTLGTPTEGAAPAGTPADPVSVDIAKIAGVNASRAPEPQSGIPDAYPRTLTGANLRARLALGQFPAARGTTPLEPGASAELARRLGITPTVSTGGAVALFPPNVSADLASGLRQDMAAALAPLRDLIGGQRFDTLLNAAQSATVARNAALVEPAAGLANLPLATVATDSAGLPHLIPLGQYRSIPVPAVSVTAGRSVPLQAPAVSASVVAGASALGQASDFSAWLAHLDALSEGARNAAAAQKDAAQKAHDLTVSAAESVAMAGGTFFTTVSSAAEKIKAGLDPTGDIASGLSGAAASLSAVGGKFGTAIGEFGGFIGAFGSLVSSFNSLFNTDAKTITLPSGRQISVKRVGGALVEVPLDIAHEVPAGGAFGSAANLQTPQIGLSIPTANASPALSAVRLDADRLFSGAVDRYARLVTAEQSIVSKFGAAVDKLQRRSSDPGVNTMGA